MIKIAFPFSSRARSSDLADLHVALRVLLNGAAVNAPEDVRRTLEADLEREQLEWIFGEATRKLVQLIQTQHGLSGAGEVDATTAELIQRLFNDHANATLSEVKGTVSSADGSPIHDVVVRAFARHLRAERSVGLAHTSADGSYCIRYAGPHSSRGLDLVVKALDRHGAALSASPIAFEAPRELVIDLAIPADKFQPVPLFDRILGGVDKVRGDLAVADLEQDAEHDDLVYLAGELRIDRSTVARLCMAYRLASRTLPPQAWFALLGAGGFQYDDTQSLSSQRDAYLAKLSTLDDAGIAKALDAAFSRNDIALKLREHRGAWIAGMSEAAAGHSVQTSDAGKLVSAVLHAVGVRDAATQQRFVRMYAASRRLTPELLGALAQDPSLTPEQVADLSAALRISELANADFTLVSTVRDQHRIRRPEQVAQLAKLSLDEWQATVEKAVAAGARVPLDIANDHVPVAPSTTTLYARDLERTFRETFPTAAFAGGLQRATAAGRAHGFTQPEQLSAFLDAHPQFELDRTPIDTFLANGIAPALSTVRDDAAFRSQLKAAQRVFKLASTFDATNSLLADGVHSAQAVYRIGATGFVRAYGNRPGFTPDTARIAWNRAAETHAMVLTIVGDLKSLDGETLPAALRSADTAALQTFPNWNNLFQGGDICECQECRSVLSPTAYFTDLLMFLRDRKTGTGKSVKDVLFTRRPDLGFLELSCDNANTTLPYIDVVCEVLERVVAAGDNDVELAGFASMPATDTAAHAAVAAALAAANVDVGATFTLTAVPAPATNEWVVHGETAVYLLKKKATPNFFAVILPNTKASADELRAYPAYVDPAAYAKLREIGFPFALPFDLFAEEVRAFFLTCDLRRWELMDTFRGPSAPTNPSDVDIACEYFAISSNPTAATDEHRLILDEDLTAAGQQVLWGEAGNAAWLSTVANVARFLNKTSLAYVDLLVLLDLKFINPTGSIQIEHDDNSCDTYKKNLTSLDPAALDRIHRFLRMWRKLPGWKMWELDLAIRCSGIGNGVVDEQFVVQLFYAARLKQRLGSRATVEQICGLVSNLSTETYFTKLHEPRKDGLYQSIYLNRRLVQPLDHAFDVSAVDVPPPTTEKISGHRSVIIAALGLSEADLDVLIRLRKASDGSLYLTDDLTLASLSFLWRHGWLAKQLKIKPAVWQLAVQLLAQDVEAFANARVAFEYVEMLDQATQSGFTMDQLDWILAADRSAKSAPKDADVTRFLTSLRAELQTIHASYDPTQYDFLSPPTDVDRLTALLTSLLQQLDRDDSAAQFFIATLSDTVQQQVAVTGLPVGFDFPGSIKSTITIRYDEPSHVLRFSGLMTTAQRTTLLTDPSLAPVTALPSYQQAIAALFDAPRLAIKFLDPVFVAPLAVLPPAVDFRMLSAGLAQRVSYDVENREVRIVGVLSAEDVNALDGLSADPSYRGAVQSLFTQPRAGTFPLEVLWLEDADLSFPLRDLDHPASDHLATNLATAITKALAYLTKTQSEGSVIRQASAQLALSESLTRDLFTEYAIFPPGTLLQHFTGPFAGSSGAIDYNAAKPTFDGWGWAVRAALLWKQWHVTADEVDALTRIASSAKLLDLLSLPLDSGGPLASLDRLVRTSRLRRFAASVPEGNVTVLDVLGRLGTYASVMAFADDVAAFNDTWSANDVAALVSALDAAYPADYYLAETWARIARAFSFARALAASTATADRFAAATMTDADARVLRDLLRAKFGADTWLSLSAQVQDTIRERKRDALAAYLLAQPQPTDAPSGKWDDTNDLYAYYLLDVEMCSCQLTSRLVQGSGSIQLFVQRCFMGLEPQVAVVDSGDDGDTAWLWWRWMSKYRVWEANRKIFLWPENWIEPELKKDRSSFFKDLENDLLQNETTQENVEKAFTSYLEKLDAVAQLEIAGFYQEDNGDETIVHVFGRTLGAEPHIYYYRRFDYRQWTPWEKVDLDIKGDYLIPAVVGGRLFLFWPVFTEVPDEDSASTATIPAATPGSTTVKKTSKRLKLQMAVSDYRQGRWTPRRLSKEYVETASYDVEITRKHYTFYPVDRTDIDGRFGVKFKGYSVDRNDKPLASLYGGFEITGCQGVPIASDLPGDILLMIRPELESTGTDTTFNKWEELTSRADAPSSDFTLLNTLFGPVETNALTPVLAQTPPQTRLRLFDMIPAWHASYLDRLLADGIAGLTNIQRYWITPVGTWLPWFFGDQKRTFFVLPVLWKGGKRDGNDPGTVTGYYYPYVKQVVRQMEAFYRAQVEQYVAGLDLTQLTPAERAAAEQFLAQQFPSENIPPFTDDQLRALLVRFYMRKIHYYLGVIAYELFQLRKFHFKMFFHPFACDFAKRVYDPMQGIPGLMRREVQLQDTAFSFKSVYLPTPNVVDPSTEKYYPHENVDFDPDGAYAPYNWELFFHAPLLVANLLSQNQQFEQARDWYHYIFNPIGVESAQPGGSLATSKYWITKPFYETTDRQYLQQRIENLLAMLAGDTTTPGYDPNVAKDVQDQVRDWRDNPFEPHRIAAYRTVAYQKTVVMKYLDNLIAWGDNLFRQDSMESINEATQLYVLAAEILGPRPQTLPPRAIPPLETFNEIEPSLDAFANALVEVENIVPTQPGNDPGNTPPLPMLYFCIPHNDKLLGYWDTIADRLYKIRHCMNIDGVVRQLALFEPPIDPGALVKAVAGGVDLSAALADLQAPVPFYRFSVILQKAQDVCADLKGLSSALLAALEKNDGEELALLRQSQERQLLDAIRVVRQHQVDEATESLENAKHAKTLAETKKKYYESRDFMNAGEIAATTLSAAGLVSQAAGVISDVLAGVMFLIPDFKIGASGFGGSPHFAAEIPSGNKVANSTRRGANGLYNLAQIFEKSAQLSSTIAGYQRRQDEWDFQKDIATKEMDQIDHQIAAAQARLDAATQELTNHDLQIENAKAVDDLMHSKYTNQELYRWQIGQVSGVYFQTYKLAYDLAKRAERCLRYELGLQDSSYISFGYWDSLKKGLLAGEKLQYDLRRLEAAYIDQNRREFELTKHVSLALLDPIALVTLRETGRCFFRVPEELFDLDYPGHYFRRIKSVSITLPAVRGPYTTVSCTMRLLKNSYRVNTLDGDNGYPHNVDDDGLPIDDPRFVESNVQVRAIATSAAQDDAGVFELAFRDERYLPFEGAGAVSDWSLELFTDIPSNNPDPANPDYGRPLRQFDYATITDAVVHVKYTAREDAGGFRNRAISHLRDYFSEDATTPGALMLDLRRDFPMQWSRFQNPTNTSTGNVFELEVSSDLFPFRDANRTLKINSLQLLARCTDAGNYTAVLSPPLPAPPPMGSNTMTLARNKLYGGLHFNAKAVDVDDIVVDPTSPATTWKIKVTRPGGANLAKDDVEDAYLVLGYQWA